MQYSQLASVLSVLGKTQPKLETKCALAQALNVSVADIFPEDFLYTEIYSYIDYLELASKVIKQLEQTIEKRKASKEKAVIQHIAEEVHIGHMRLYELLARRNKPSHREIQLLVDNLSLKIF